MAGLKHKITFDNPKGTLSQADDFVMM